MIKATLSFDLPEDEIAHRLAVGGADYAAVCCDIDGWLRNKLKYDELPADADEALQEARDMLREFLDSRNVSLEGL